MTVFAAWSLAHDLPDGVPTSVHFNREVSRYVQEGSARLLSEVSDGEQVEREVSVILRGVVVTLKRERTSASGSVTIHGTVSAIDGRTLSLRLRGYNKVQVTLSQQDYNAAVEAHLRHFDVECRGTIELRGNRYRLTDTSGFIVERRQ